jgi:hypothetical protein
MASTKFETKTITLKELNDEATFLKLTDDTPIYINIGTKYYEVISVITGTANGNYGLILECGVSIGRPPKYATEEARQTARKEKQREYVRRYSRKKKSS